METKKVKGYEILSESEQKEDKFIQTNPLTILKNELAALKDMNNNLEQRYKNFSIKLDQIEQIINKEWPRINELSDSEQKINFLNNLLTKIKVRTTQ